MTVAHIEIFVEEPSMEAALRTLLPPLLPNITFEVYPHQCKDELIARLPQRLRGYRAWLPPDWRILIVVDRDDDACHALKERLETIARDVGLVTKTMARGGPYYSNSLSS